MKTILFDHIPIDITAWHEAKGAAASINGGFVLYQSAVRALLRYSSYERFIFVSRNRRHPYSFDKNEEFRNSSRDVQIVHPSEISGLRDLDQTVMLTTTERLGPLLRLRRMFDHHWLPVAGLLSATHPTWFGPFLVEMALAGITEHDLLICSSHTSLAVLKSLVALICPQQDSGDQILRCSMQTPVVPLGIDCSEFKGRSAEARQQLGFAENEVVLLYMGRFEMSGKADLGPLMVAFSRLRRKPGRCIRLVLAGADRNKLSGLLAEFAGQLGCSDAVVVRPDPSEKEKMDLLSAADVFCSPGDGVPESFGLTPIEAMAAGLPCVVSDWDGYRETVVHEKCGFHVSSFWSDLGPCADAFENCGIEPAFTLAATTALDLGILEHYLGLLVDNGDLRRQMGLNAKAHALKHFDWPVIVRQYEALFEEQLERSREFALLEEQREDAPLRSTQALYGHYPTYSIAPEDVISFTEAGREWLKKPFSLGMALSQHELIKDDLCLQVAEVLQAGDSLSFGSLIQKVSECTGKPSWLTRINAMRLLKYGVLGMRSAQSNLSQDIDEAKVMTSLP